MRRNPVDEDTTVKLSTVTALPLLAGLLALPLSAAAADAAAPAAAASPAADKPAADKPVADASDASLKKVNKDCPTGATRIRRQGCDGPVPYRRFSKEEIDTTGRLDMAEALRQLDPIFQ